MHSTVTCMKWIAVALAAATMALACKRGTGSHDSRGNREKKVSIQDIGSDTLVNVAQAWAEAYAEIEKEVSIEVSGGGSGVGIAALMNGTAQIANASREIEPAEAAKIRNATGNDPKEFMVGYDGLAIYVHKNNPLEQISVEELGHIYREDGSISKWSDLGVTIPGSKSDRIIRVSRQNNSGTYQYFREHVLGKTADFKQGSLDMNGSKDVVELVARTPGAIGYSGLGYATHEVKVLKVSMKKDQPAVAPSVATIHAKAYPISRPLYMYTPGEPVGAVAKYLAWIMSPVGQEILQKTGFIPAAH
jgi:phosphate transport system substrate-binding protein